jgi:hypothetical protein
MKKLKEKIDMQEMMEIYKKVGTPGEPHKLLAKLEGSWTTKSIGWEQGKRFGRAAHAAKRCGHYLEQTYTGDMERHLPYKRPGTFHSEVRVDLADSMSAAIYTAREARMAGPYAGGLRRLKGPVSAVLPGSGRQYPGVWVFIGQAVRKKMMEMTVARKKPRSQGGVKE